MKLPLLSYSAFPDFLRFLQLKTQTQSWSLTFLCLLKAERSGKCRKIHNGESLLILLVTCPDNCVVHITGSDLCESSKTSSNYLRILRIRQEMLLSLTYHPTFTYLFQKTSQINLTIKEMWISAIVVRALLYPSFELDNWVISSSC